MRITQLWLLFLLFHPSVPAQWVQQSFPSTEYLARVRFHNEQTGWILGGEQIYRTDDGGVTWVPKDSTGGLGLVLALADDSTIVYANSSGLIRRTSDGGETWRTIDDHGAYYEDMTFVDSLTGFAVGSDTGAPSAIWKTTDGGASWVMVADTLPPAGHNGVGVSFVDPMTGYVLTYDEEMFRTTDGGVTWNHVDSFQPSYAPMSSDDVQFIDADHGWAIGGISGSIYIARTTDGGVTWQDSTGGGSTREIDFVDDQTGWIVQGLGDVPMKSTDGGRTWERQISGSLPPMESIDMIDDQIGWIVGGGGTVYRTMNGGSAPNHQPDSVLAFYPLQIGNKWQYLYSYCYCECQTPTESYHIEEVVGDTVLGNGLRYQVLISDLPETEYTQFFRVDSLTGNIYRYSGGAEVLHDSLLASEGSTFMTDWGYLTECTEVTADTVLGLPTIVKRFRVYFVHGGDYELGHRLGRTVLNTYHEDCLPMLFTKHLELVYAQIGGEEFGTLVGVTEAETEAPTQFSLHQNYPNPFNAISNFEFRILEVEDVSLIVYDMLGREAARVVNERLAPGRYTRQWDAAGLPSGVYYYRMTAGSYVETKKLVLLR